MILLTLPDMVARLVDIGLIIAGIWASLRWPDSGRNAEGQMRITHQRAASFVNDDTDHRPPRNYHTW